MKKIAIIKPPETYARWKRSPIVGISYISACLEKSGFKSKIFDSHFSGWSETELIRSVERYRPDIIGLTAMTHEVVQAAGVASRIKEKLGTPAIIGGCHVTALPKITLDEFPVFDFGVYGEGEKTILELLQWLFSNKLSENLRFIKGLVFRDGREIVMNGTRPFLTAEELDRLPFPAFHNYFLHDPQPLSMKDTRYPMFTSRGCPYNCAFCMRVLGTKVRRRSADNVCREIEHAIACYGACTFEFNDEIFISDCAETRQLLRAFIETGLSRRIKWVANTRANAVTPEIIGLAKKAGCFMLAMGVESGDDEILNAISKGITVEQIRKAVKIIKDAEILLNTYFIIGHPNETKRTAKKTVDLSVELNTERIYVGVMVPYPGTKIYDMAKRGKGGYRLLSENWADYDKYGGRALELKGFSNKEMRRYQKQAFINFYLKNYRVVDLIKFILETRYAIYFFIKRKMRSLFLIRTTAQS